MLTERVCAGAEGGGEGRWREREIKKEWFGKTETYIFVRMLLSLG